MDEERELFERESAKLFPFHKMYALGGNDTYCDLHCELAWQLWQAARAASADEIAELRAKLAGAQNTIHQTRQSRDTAHAVEKVLREALAYIGGSLTYVTDEHLVAIRNTAFQALIQADIFRKERA